MDIFKQKNTLYIVLSSILSAVMFGAVLFSGILINASSKLSSSTGVYEIRFGILELGKLHKQSSQLGGYNAGIGFGFGLLIYFCIFIVAGIVVSVIRLRLRANDNSK